MRTEEEWEKGDTNPFPPQEQPGANLLQVLLPVLTWFKSCTSYLWVAFPLAISQVRATSL